MHPLFGDAKRSSEQMNLAGFITSAHEDYRSFEWGVEIELELLGERSAVWGAVSTRCGLAAVSADVALGDRHQGLAVGQWWRCQTLACHKPLKPSMAFWKPGSRGGANTGMTFNA